MPGSAGLAALALGWLLDDEAELARARGLLEPLGTWGWHHRLGRAAWRRRPSVARAASNGRPGQPRMPSGSGPAGECRPARPSGRGCRQPDQSEEAPVRLRCLGGFSIAIDGRAVDESAAKPMERALLHLLAARAGEPVHREALMEALWPEADPDAGLHRLQVAISALRRLLTAGSSGPVHLLAREGDSYRLVLPEGSDCDLWQFEANLRRAAAARSSGLDGAEEEALEAALAGYGGPLLPGDGPVDWVVDRRAGLQQAAADAAARLATLRLERGQHRAATVGRSGRPGPGPLPGRAVAVTHRGRGPIRSSRRSGPGPTGLRGGARGAGSLSDRFGHGRGAHPMTSTVT